MIRLSRPAAPDILRRRGKNLRRQNSLRYHHNETAYRAGIEKFAFKNSVYAHATVKSTLKAMQGNKCVYCESKLDVSGYPEVEHFRPKAKVTGPDEQYPGYYWLSYEWSNLFYSCRRCNGSKRNQFPLEDEAQRVRSHRLHSALSRERPLLIKPDEENPLDFLSFESERLSPYEGSLKGSKSIEVYDLNRRELKNMRLDKINMMSTLITMVKIGPEDLQRRAAARHIAKYTKADAKYAQVARRVITRELGIAGFPTSEDAILRAAAAASIKGA